jgi:hypothetical protein
MAKNTYFRHGTRNEQMLQQSLVDEFIKMFGQEILYIPRKLIRQDYILNEEIITQFDDSFLTYAYFENFEGFAGNGDILTKFGIRSTDEITLSLSRQMFTDFIATQMFGVDGIQVGTRPQEGDLIYFGLTDNIFEIKFVEHETPFYQFGALYTYQLKCELYEYENEVAGTGDIFATQEDEGFVVKYFYDLTTLSGSPEIGELVIGSITGISARINSWNPTERYIELRAPIATADYSEFVVGETLTGQTTGFSINISRFDELDMKDAYAQNIEFETIGDGILDFTERNPFGEFGNRS